MTPQQVDAKKAAAFQAQMVDVLNSSFLGLADERWTPLGTVRRDGRPGLGHGCRDGTGYRFAGTLCSGMACRDGGRSHRRIRRGRKVPLTARAFCGHCREAGLGNMASRMCFIGYLGEVEEDVVTAFRNGGGVPYSRYPRFLDQLARNSAARFDANLLNVTLPLVDGVEQRLLEGIDVLDVGCGHGRAINVMAQAYPASRFLGVDVTAQSIDGARAEAASWGSQNARFEVRDAATLGRARELRLHHNVRCDPRPGRSG